MTTHLLPPISDPAQAAHDLRRAADVSSARGWTQGELINLRGQVCALGAIYLACGWNGELGVLMGSVYSNDQRAQDAVTALAMVLPPVYEEKFPSVATRAQIRVYTYNDSHCTGGEQLRQKLLQAADELAQVAASPQLSDIGPIRRKVDLEPLEEPLPVSVPEPVKVPEPAQ